jgi:hypothetical protein
VGELVIHFSGEREDIQSGIDYFRSKGLRVEVIDHGRDTSKIYTKCS